MWHIRQFDFIPVQLDFTSSSQGRPAATAVVSDGIQLVNALEFVDVESNLAQVEVCECCGFSHCSPGGWVALRRLGEHVAWIPVWTEMDHGPWEVSEFAPPHYIGKRGAPLFRADDWDRFRVLNDQLPPAPALPPLSSRELIRLAQLSAPGRVLGTYPEEPRLRRELLLAVTDGELMTEANSAARFVRSCFEHDLPVELRADSADQRPIEFWLDLPGTPAWTSFARFGREVIFLLDGSLPLSFREI